jgi:hypothetical protein
MREDQIGLPLRYRIGPAQDDHAAASFTEIVATAEGLGLAPFAPVQLAARRDAGSGDIALAWIRRTRFGGTAWELAEVPLNEEREAYRLEFLDGVEIVRTVETATPSYLYTLAEQTADFGGPAAPFALRVAQLCAAVGTGLKLQETVDA